MDEAIGRIPGADLLAGRGFLVMQAVALATMTIVLVRRARTCGVRDARAVAVAAALGAIAGAPLLGMLLRTPRALLGDGVDPFAPGLLMAYGALFGAIAAVALTAQGGAARSARLDALAPALGALVAVGRSGCALAGCCFGHATSLPWATGDGRHPTALYEVALGLAMIGVALARPPSGARPTALVRTVALYAAGRFAIEALRADPRPLAGPLTLPQWISVVVLAGAAALALSWSQEPLNEAGRLSRNARIPSR
jgi:phosphatidylglycerol:prolipoprotein diacylglycerol transferase